MPIADVQELCVGGTLADLMRSGGLATPNGGIHARRINTILIHVATGLHHLHACGLTSGDLNPTHILLQVLPLCAALLIIVVSVPVSAWLKTDGWFYLCRELVQNLKQGLCIFPSASP